MNKDLVTVARVDSDRDREDALQVLRSVYIDEKAWAPTNDELLPETDLGNDGLSWFLARVDNRPVGAVRVLYDLPLDLYEDYGIKVLDPSIDVKRFLTENRIAEVGRFAVCSEERGHFLVAVALVRAVATETIARGFTHFITDVFEGEPNSPYEFHTRVLGFEPVAFHDHGELQASYRRITMLLDLRRAYDRMKSRRSWLARQIFAAWDDDMHRIAAGATA